MEDKIYYIEPLIERTQEYGKISYKIIKLKALKKTAEILSTFISRVSAIISFSIFLVFANISLALWLGETLGKTYLGFFYVAIFYVLLGGVLYFFMHKIIKKYISNIIITQVLN